MPVSRRIASLLAVLTFLGVTAGKTQTAPDSLFVAALEAAVADGYLDAYAVNRAGEMYLVEGPRYQISRVVVNDSLVQPADGLRYASQTEIDHVLRRLVSGWQDRGFYYARARVERLAKTGGSVTLFITINPGPRVAFGRLVLKGLTRSGEDQVRRYLTTTDTSTVNDRLLEDLTRRARNIDYLIFEPPIELRPRPGYTVADIGVRFREKEQVRIAGGAGYAPDDETGLVWRLDLALTNLFGGGRAVRVQSARPNRGRTILDIGYRQPVFLLGLDRLSFAVATRDYRDDFYEFGVTGEYRTQLTPSFRVSLRTGWRRVEPGGEATGYSVYRVGLSGERSTLDLPLNPTRGYRLLSGIDYVYRRYSEDSVAARPEGTSFNETRTRLHAEGYQRIVGSFVGKVAVAYEGYESEQDLPPLAELILIGGPGSLRGYRTEQFAVRRTAYGTIEPRYRFANGYTFLFFDAAYLNWTLPGESGITTEERFEWSVGFGLSLSQAQRGVTITFGWGRDVPLDQPRLGIELQSDI